MAGRPSYAAADVSYLLERDTITNTAARPRREQRRLAQGHSHYEDDEDMAHIWDRRFRSPLNNQYQDLHPLGTGPRYEDDENSTPPQSRGSYPPLSHQYNGINPQEPGRRGRQYRAPSPNDSLDGLDCGRCGCRPTHSPSPYDDAVDDESIFDHERRRGLRRHDLGNDRLPLYARGMEMNDFDEESFRDMSLDPRSPRSQRGFLGSRDMDLNQLYGLEPRVRRGVEPRPDDYDSNLNMGPRGDRLDFGRAGVRGTGRSRTRHRLEDDFEDGIFEDNLRAPRQHRRPRLTGDRSDLDFRSVDDDIEDDFTGEFRAPTAAEIRHRQFLVRMHDELDAEELDAEDREHERREALIEEEFEEEDFEFEDVGRGLRRRRGQTPRAAGPRPAANFSDGDIDEFPRGRRGNPSRPLEAGNRQTPRQKPHANGSVGRVRDRNQQAPPSYDSVTPTQLYTHTQAEQDSDAYRPPVAATVSENAKSRPVAAAIANKTAEGIAERASKEVLHGQQHAQNPNNHANNGRTTHNGTKAINNPDNLDTVPPPQRVAQKIPLDSAHTPQAAVGEHGHSDSSDSGFDTPDDNSETSGARDEDLGEGNFVESSIRITL